jgi:hypothetical protein
MREAAIATVSGRLISGDPDAARAALTAAAAALRGSARVTRDEPGLAVLELEVPRDAYPELLQRLGALGTWRADREPPASADPVALSVQITR